MPPLTRLMKDIQLGNTLYSHWNGNVEIGMLKSAPKTLIFSSWAHIIIIFMCNFFQIILRYKKKIWGCEVTTWNVFSILKKFTKIHTLIIFWSDCTNRFSVKNYFFIVHKLLVMSTYWIFNKCSCKSHVVY